MANQNNAFGLQPLFGAKGAPANHEMDTASILYSYGTKIFRGDPVLRSTTGQYIQAWTAGTSVSTLAGIFWGCTYLSTAMGKQVQSQFWPAGDVASGAQNSIQAYIVPLIGAVPYRFKAQSDATGITAANIGLNIDLNMGAGGSTYTGWSSAYLDTTTMSTTNTLPFTIDALYGGQWGAGGYGGIQPSTTNPYGGSATGGFNWVIVRPNLGSNTGI